LNLLLLESYNSCACEYYSDISMHSVRFIFCYTLHMKINSKITITNLFMFYWANIISSLCFCHKVNICKGRSKFKGHLQYVYIVIYFSCKWIFARWQWYYNKTQHTKMHVSHKITHHAQIKYSTQTCKTIKETLHSVDTIKIQLINIR
jgi:hypothetical protein